MVKYHNKRHLHLKKFKIYRNVYNFLKNNLVFKKNVLHLSRNEKFEERLGK